MNSKDLRRSLKSKPVTISLNGKEIVFIKEAISEIKKFFIPKDLLEFNTDLIENMSIRESASILSEVPFGCDNRVVFCTKAEDLLKYRNDTTILVAIDGSIKEPELAVDCRRVYGRRLKSYIRSKTKALDMKLDAEDVTSFVTLNGNDLLTIENELTKLSCISNMDSSTIKNLGSFNLQSNLKDFFTSFVRRDIGSMMLNYHKLIHLGSTDSQLLGFIIYGIKKLFIAKFILEEEPKEFELRDYWKWRELFSEERLYSTINSIKINEFFIRNGSMPLYIFLVSEFKKNSSNLDSFRKRLED